MRQPGFVFLHKWQHVIALISVVVTLLIGVLSYHSVEVKTPPTVGDCSAVISGQTGNVSIDCRRGADKEDPKRLDVVLTSSMFPDLAETANMLSRFVSQNENKIVYLYLCTDAEFTYVSESPDEFGVISVIAVPNDDPLQGVDGNIYRVRVSDPQLTPTDWRSGCFHTKGYFSVSIIGTAQGWLVWMLDYIETRDYLLSR